MNEKWNEKWLEYNKLKKEIADDINILKNKSASLMRIKSDLTGTKIPFHEFLLGHILQDLEMYMDGFNFGYLQLSLPSRIKMIEKHIESLFNKKDN